MGNTIIHKAASLGHAESLMLLLERTGARPDIMNAALATPLHLACKNNRVDAAKFLIGCGVDANAQDEHGQVPLLICCIHGHFDLARMIVDAHMSGHLPEPLEVDIKDHRGLSPLNCAAIKGDFKMTMLLVLNAGAVVDGTSPKGCTPLLYAARGGYAEVVRFLLLKGASPLAQDNAGGTVLHHAIEKGHLAVLTTLQEHGVDVHSAIEIPDNAGRTPVFEAVDSSESLEILKLITRSREQGGFGAEVNLTNYNGQTPLFSAAREGNLEVIRYLVEECDAKVDLTQGELYAEEEEHGEDNYDSLEEKFFMEAYKNSMTPLQVSVILGNEDVMLYLIEKGANPNLQTKLKGFSCLHLAVLANKPEIIIELLTKTNANPDLPDFGGRTLRDMIEIFIPSYLESFGKLLENLAHMKQAEATSTQEESVLGLARKGEEEPVVATHYYNPDDERSLQGLGAVADKNKMLDLYAKADAHPNKENDAQISNEAKARKLAEVDESEVTVEHEHLMDSAVTAVYGLKIAKALIAVDWRFKEQALKYIFKLADKFLDPANAAEGKSDEQQQKLEEVAKACIAAVSLTCKEKVIKVFQVSLQLFGLLVNSKRIEKSGVMDALKNTIVEKNIVLKLLQKSEEGNTRITNKIHETLLDLSYNPEVGEALTSSFILQRVQAHNRAILQKAAQKKQSEHADSTGDLQQISTSEKIETEQSLGNYKGLLAQLALLFKFVNSFGIASQTRGPLSVKDVLKAVLPSVQHANNDVRNAATKILLDVQKLSGCVTDDELVTAGLSEKARNVLNTKLSEVTIEKNLAASQSRVKQSKLVQNVQQIREEEADGEQTDRAEVPETISANSPMKGEIKHNAFADLRQVIEEKSARKDWQERELALKAMEEAFQDRPASQAFDTKDLLGDQFLQACLYLLKTCLEENNMTLYLLALEVAAGGFLKKTLHTDLVNGYLQSLITPVIMRTTDTNTRIRKRSVELINQIWDHKPYSFGLHAAAVKDNKLKLSNPRDSIDGANEAERKTDLICQLIAQVLCDSSHGEKAIVGRLGLFIKRGSQIEGGKDLLNKPLQVVIGRTYEQLTEFACQWIGHKNTKIRQNAMRLIVEVCRINCMDPRGAPFKQRIVNYILGLRQSQRDPLVKKINEVCLKHIVANTSPGRANSLEAYIDVSELELSVATKSRAASMDHVGAKRRLQSATRRSKDGTVNNRSNAMLPQIGSASNAMPAITNVAGGPAQPTTVLPHSEPLSDEQKQQHASLIEMMGLPIMTCFLSKNWATRFAAIQKVEEQLPNLDPSRRDAMSAEINRQNLPAELTFVTFLLFVSEGIRDPVLKNFVQILELLQQALPTFFRYLKPDEIKKELTPIISEVLRKTADMKQKIRESASNFCLYLSHQSPVGPEFMIQQVLKELVLVASSQSSTENAGKDAKQASSIAASYGNSHMIVACINLLNEFQIQSKILHEKGDQEMLKQFMTQINVALRHSNPQVRKEAEKLFKTLYVEFGQDLESQLVDQKPALQQKLIQQAKLEVIANDKSASNKPTSQQPNKAVRTQAQEKQIEAAGVQRAHDKIRDQVFNLSQLATVLGGAEEHLEALKLPNVKRRQKAIIELKKAISKKIVADQMSQDKARDVFEPLTMLMRHLLQDSDSDVYIESLSLLKFVVGSLAPYLTSLDLHLMMGQFVGIIVHNTVEANMRVQVQTDKVVVFFAKHQNIGSLVVAKELTKNIERLNEAVKGAGPLPEQQLESLAQNREHLLRFYGILQLLLQQFSIILCYQQEFYTKCLECLADTLNIASLQAGNSRQQVVREQQEDQAVALKNLCQQIVFNLYATDSKLLDKAVGQLSDLSRKTPLRKIIIEHESLQKQGKGYMDVGKQAQYSQINPAAQQPGAQTIDPMRDTKMSFASSTNRQSLFSPGSHATRGQSPGGFGASQYGGGDLNSTWKSQFRLDGSNAKLPSPSLDADSSKRRPTMNRRMMSTGERSTLQASAQPSEDYLADHPVSAMTQQSWRRQQDVLPALPGGAGSSLNRTGQLLPQIGGNGMGMSYKFDAGSAQQSPEVPRRRMGDPSAAMPPKFKLKSTGGAGFSSQSNSQNQHTSTAGGSFYEPSSSSRRTPRRTLANVLNNANMQPSGSDISKIGGLGAAAAQMQKWPTQQETASAMRMTDESANVQATASGKTAGGAIKPPLYVPTRRQPSENTRRSVERAAPTSGAQVGYKPRTGFSTMGLGASSSATGSSEIPYEKTELGPGVGSGLGGAVSKPIARPPREGSRGASGSRIQSMFGAPEAASSTITGYVPSGRH